MIADAHVHIGKSTRLQIDVDGEFLVRQADELGIGKLCCTDLTALFYDAREGNRLLYAEMRRFPDRILGYATLPSVRFGRAGIEEIERCYHDYGMRGLKLYSTPEMSLAETASIPVLEKCVELDIPILAHTTPQECEYLLSRVPQAKLIMAHTGGQPWAKGDWQRALMAARAFENLHLDLTSSTIDTGLVEAAVEAAGAQRVLFGTDMPLLDPWVQLTKVRNTRLAPHHLDLVLGGNILRLMGVAR